MRTCTSAAPASKSIATSCRVVLPRTIESSTATTRFPATSSSGLNFSRMPRWQELLVGLDERAADVTVLDQALAERDVTAREKPTAAGVPSQGWGDEVCVDEALPLPAARPSARAQRGPLRRQVRVRPEK